MFERKCPNCNSLIIYGNKQRFSREEKQKLHCDDCRKIEKTINNQEYANYRECLKCNRFIFYDNLVKLSELQKRTKQGKLCRSCIAENSMKGKTVYDVWINNYGKDIADKKLEEMKKKQSQNTKGENNPNYGGKYSRFEAAIEWTLENLRGKTINEAYGDDKANNIKKKISKKCSGKNNGMYGKPTPQGSGNGWSGNYMGIHFRSLNELFYLKYLLDNNIRFDNAEKKKYRVEYEFNNKKLSYGMDFYLLDTNEYIEIKPIKLVDSPKNVAKFKSAREKYGDKFKVITEEDLIPINTEEMYQLYLSRDLIFDKKYEEKFLKYYQKEMSEKSGQITNL